MSDASHAVFLSYAREDTDAARRIADALRGFGVEVWFDQSELRGGDAWDQKIRQQIKDCTLFVPVISAHTEARGEGYFRLEWKLADERTHLMAKGVPFLLPVVVDATGDGEAMVPDSFRAVQWTRLAGGTPTPDFVAQVKRLLASPRKSVAAKKSETSAPHTTAAPVAVKSGFPIGIIAALGAVVLALVAFILLRPAAKETPAAPAPAKPAVAEAKVAPTAPASVVNDKSIAVLPFENLSEDKENTAFFSDGMQEDILTNLANIPELRVVSRTSVMEYRNTTKKIPQIARELGVAYILEGSVRRAGTQVRITGQLIRAADDVHLWAKSYDRELTPKEMFAIQAALSTEIAGALQAAITPGTKKLLERRPTENLAAYEAYLKARSLSIVTPTTVKPREKFLQAAVELDPNFAEAWGELAAGHAAMVFKNYDNTAARLAQADAAIARAVRLAPDDSEVIRLEGTYAYYGYRDYARALRQFEKVLRLQPSNAGAIFSSGLVQRRQGRITEGNRNLIRGVELDPGNPLYLNQLANALVDQRQWDEALAVQRRLIALRPNDLTAQGRLVRLQYQATGSTKEAEAWLAGLTPAHFNSAYIVSVRTYWAAVKDDFEEWKRLDSLQPDYADSGSQPGEQAIAAAMRLTLHGDIQGARARLGNLSVEMKSLLERQPSNALLWGEFAKLEAVLGEKEAALRDAQKGVDLLPPSLDAVDGRSTLWNRAAVYAWTGEKDRAIAELTKVLEVGFVSTWGVRESVYFAPLRGDPRFEALLNDPKNNAPLF